MAHVAGLSRRRGMHLRPAQPVVVVRRRAWTRLRGGRATIDHNGRADAARRDAAVRVEPGLDAAAEARARGGNPGAREPRAHVVPRVYLLTGCRRRVPGADAGADAHRGEPRGMKRAAFARANELGESPFWASGWSSACARVDIRAARASGSASIKTNIGSCRRSRGWTAPAAASCWRCATGYLRAHGALLVIVRFRATLSRQG